MSVDITKQAELDEIKADILAADICPDLRESATQLVFASGSPDAEVVFIGEAPGKNEDEQGRPFVGAAGKFLDEMLGLIGMSRDDIYITNIVKYRPPGNRDPSPEEKRAFWPYLVRQLDVILPKLVVTLGRHSMEYFLPEQKISQIHGQPKRIQFGERRQVIMPLFHPAAALYNGSMRQTLIEDFGQIPLILEKFNNNILKRRNI